MLNSLQILRGLAAWSVVFYHIRAWYFMGDTEHIFWALFNRFGEYGVDIFFVVSGVVMALVSRKYQNKSVVFLANRLYRVVPTYWLYLFIMAFSIAVLPDEVYPTSLGDYSLLKSMFFIPHVNSSGFGNYPILIAGWTLIYEMFFYLIFFLVLFLKIPKASISCALILCGIAIIFRQSDFLGYSSLLLLEFSIGIFIYEYFEISLNKSNLLYKAIPALVFVALIFVFEFFNDSFPSSIFMSGLAVYLFILSEPLLTGNSKVLRLLRALGDYSYSTYLSHLIVIGWIYYLFGNGGHGVYDLIGVLCIVLIVGILSKYSYKGIERNKYLSSLQRYTARSVKEV